MCFSFSPVGRRGRLLGRLPKPLAVLKAAVSLTLFGELWQHVKVSTWRASTGFAFGGASTPAPRIVEQPGFCTGKIR